VSSSPRAQQALALEAMFALADEALYLAKRQGRNQVVMAAEPLAGGCNSGVLSTDQ
jgi:predicted signal transduction protein with EAL and GGDEF domain